MKQKKPMPKSKVIEIHPKIPKGWKKMPETTEARRGDLLVEVNYRRMYAKNDDEDYTYSTFTILRKK